ncbi:hypothetical protein M3Y97_00825400 [Aphelenchoides bicaudatus]|nr:hypothetical protein M3Y97_00825400 [Aphelenchoides bicaudatus]
MEREKDRRRTQHDAFIEDPSLFTCCFLSRRYREKEHNYKKRDIYDSDPRSKSDTQEVKFQLRKQMDPQVASNDKVCSVIVLLVNLCPFQGGRTLYKQERIQAIQRLHSIMNQRWQRLEFPKQTIATNALQTGIKPSSSTTAANKTTNGTAIHSEQHQLTNSKFQLRINKFDNAFESSDCCSFSKNALTARNTMNGKTTNGLQTKRGSDTFQTTKATNTQTRNGLLRRGR